MFLLAAGLALLRPCSAGEGSVMEYDSDGRLRQLDHTLAATRRGGTVVGACFGDCGALVSWGAPTSPVIDAEESASVEGCAPGGAPDASTDRGSAAPLSLAPLSLAHPAPLLWSIGPCHAMAVTGLSGDAQVR